MDRELYDLLAELTAEIATLKAVLTQMLGSIVQASPNPPKVAADLYEALAQRLDKLPPSLGTAEADREVERAKEKLAEFFTTLRLSLKK